MLLTAGIALLHDHPLHLLGCDLAVIPAENWTRDLYYDETGRFSICDANVKPEAGDDRTYLKLYDDMVIEGKKLYDGKVVA